MNGRLEFKISNTLKSVLEINKQVLENQKEKHINNIANCLNLHYMIDEDMFKKYIDDKCKINDIVQSSIENISLKYAIEKNKIIWRYDDIRHIKFDLIQLKKILKLNFYTQLLFDEHKHGINKIDDNYFVDIDDYGLCKLISKDIDLY